MSRTLTLQIAAAYHTSRVRIVGDAHDENEWRVDEIDFKHGEYCLMKVSNGDAYTIPIYSCQLILTPLNKISEADLHVVSVYVGLHEAGNKITRTPDCVYVNNDTYQFQVGYNGYLCLRKNGVLYNANMRRPFDFLRSKDYDCGYGDIHSLIEAGIAIEQK